MPYEVRKAAEGDGFEVVNTETGDVKARHATEAEAERQKRLLEELEEGMNKPEGSDG